METESATIQPSEYDGNFLKSLTNRLVRLETKLVRGFEELGVDIDNKNGWLVVDELNKKIFLSTLGRSPMVILATMQELGAKQFGEEYSIYYKNKYFGKMKFDLLT